MTLGQRGAFPKHAFDFNGVSETALLPAWPGDQLGGGKLSGSLNSAKRGEKLTCADCVPQKPQGTLARQSLRSNTNSLQVSATYHQ